MLPAHPARSGGSKGKEAPHEGPRGAKRAWIRVDALPARGAKPLSDLPADAELFVGDGFTEFVVAAIKAEGC